jgi:arabinofuranosyltransferase
LHDQGLAYFRNSIRWDPVTLATILLSAVLVLWERNPKKIAIVLGLVSYLYYVFSIGGDFMSGRFFSASFLVAVILSLTVDYARILGPINPRMYLFAIVSIVFLGLIAEYPPVLTKQTDVDQAFDPNGIANEKLYYFKDTSWENYIQNNSIYNACEAGTEMLKTGVQLREQRNHRSWLLRGPGCLHHG